MKIKTSELSGEALHFAVAIAEGWQDFEEEGGAFSWHKEKGPAWLTLETFRPSELWEQGGPIIEREDMSFRKYHRPDSAGHGNYYARICRESGTLVGWHRTTGHQQTGPSPLIAAMRCYVASKLGDEVDIPDSIAGG